jgi:hypothetical protein
MTLTSELVGLIIDFACSAVLLVLKNWRENICSSFLNKGFTLFLQKKGTGAKREKRRIEMANIEFEEAD